MRACARCGAKYEDDRAICSADGEPLVAGDPLIGQIIDRYHVRERLGAGAVGAVYRVTHTELDADYALKVLRPDLTGNRGATARFAREARALGRVRHPNVATVTDFGHTGDGQTYFVMELVPGSNLRELIAAEAPFPPHRAAALIGQVASGLSAVHAAGYVHRDLKPSNILVLREDRSERVKIVDFGLVAVQDGVSPKLTRRGATVGTPAYMAPEQVVCAEVDALADLYALGAILFELLRGHPPFRGTAEEVLRHHLKTPPPRLDPALGLEQLALSLLAKEPTERPRSAKAVLTELERLGFAPGSDSGLRLPTPPRALARDGAGEAPEAAVLAHSSGEGKPRTTPLDGSTLGTGTTSRGSRSARRPRAKAVAGLGLVAAGAVLAVVSTARFVERLGPNDPGPPTAQDTTSTPVMTAQATPSPSVAHGVAVTATSSGSPGTPPRAREAQTLETPEARQPPRTTQAAPARGAPRMAATRSTRPDLKHRLDALASALGALAPRLPADEVLRLEEQYFSLASDLGPSSSAAEQAELAARIAALEREIRARAGK